MKTVIKSAILLTIFIGFVSCKKEVQIDLQTKESQVVIEADFSADKRVNTVYLTKTTEIRQPNSFPALSKAIVVVTDNAEYYEVLTEIKPGVYQTNSFPNHEGKTFSLKVSYDNKTYEATSTLPHLVKLDTVIAINSFFGSTPMRGFLPVYTDPQGIKNNYRFIQYINGSRLKGSILRDDEFTDGKTQQATIFDMDLVLKAGDVYKVEMQMIDEANYLYFSSKEKTVNLESAAPANPVSNFKGGALGYFNVHGSQFATMVITE